MNHFYQVLRFLGLRPLPSVLRWKVNTSTDREKIKVTKAHLTNIYSTILKTPGRWMVIPTWDRTRPRAEHQSNHRGRERSCPCVFSIRFPPQYANPEHTTPSKHPSVVRSRAVPLSLPLRDWSLAPSRGNLSSTDRLNMHKWGFRTGGHIHCGNIYRSLGFLF